MSAGGSFALNISAWCERAKDRADLVVRKVATELFSQVILASPVDTGRFRANWQVSTGAPALGTRDATDKTGGETAERARAAVSEATVGGTIFLTNNLPYARRLEYGWSGQAPAGMVRLAVARFQAIVDASVRETAS